MKHETAQNATADRLTPAQIPAMGVLLKGGNVTHAAKAAGRRREQVSRWIHKPGAFREVYRQERERMLQGVRESVDSIRRHACEVAFEAQDANRDNVANSIRSALQCVEFELANEIARRNLGPVLRDGMDEEDSMPA